MELEGEDADDGEEREEVAEDGDDLRVPEAAQHGDAQDVAHGERRGEFGVDRSGCALGSGCAHVLKTFRGVVDIGWEGRRQDS